MTDDAELLRRYAEENSEAAFAELVRRHLGLVYHAALRQCGGDAHRAEDVAQAVFTDLARKAGKLAGRPVLAGWLHTSTRYAAAQAVRTEVRRQVREREAQTMNEILTEGDAGRDAAVEWERMRPVIDEALHGLGERDREAVLLRFFEGRAFAEIGARLRLTEDAARMRVERALEKLHAALAKRGITSTAAALGGVLANQATAAAPVGVAASVTGAALAGAAVGGGGAAGFLTFMGMNKLSVGVLGAIAGVLVLNVTQQRANARLREEFRALADESRNLASMRDENRRLAAETVALVSPNADAVELARLRARVDELRKKYTASRPYLWVGGRSIAHDTLPAEKLEVLYPEGRSSPMRAWQTLLATSRNHPAVSREELLALHALMFCFDERAHRKVSAFLDALPEEVRAAFDSPERLVAPVFDEWLWKGDPPRQYGSTQRGPTDTLIEGDSSRAYTRWQITYVSGRTQEDQFPFKRLDDGWRYGPLTESEVEQILALLDPTTGQPKARPTSSAAP